MQRTHRGYAIAAGLALAALGASGAGWLLTGSSAETTDDAYLRGDITPVSPRVGGEILTVHAQANQPVAVGELLLELDSRDYQARLHNAQATVTQAESALQVNARQRQLAGLDRKLLDAERSGLQARLDSAVALAQLAQFDLDSTRVYAPVAGTVGDLVAEAGARAAPGLRLLSIVPERRLWVEANFKETQLRRIAVGQPAMVRFDALPGQSFAARVDSLAPASGSEFALLPSDNASGNFMKIVQRVGVRIALSDTDRFSELRPGLSARVNVATLPAAPIKMTTLAEPRR